jgi:hypothetical protein
VNEVIESVVGVIIAVLGVIPITMTIVGSMLFIVVLLL